MQVDIIIYLCKSIKRLQEEIFYFKILYPAKLSFKTDGRIKTFPDKQKLKESVSSPIRNIKEVLQAEIKSRE